VCPPIRNIVPTEPMHCEEGMFLDILAITGARTQSLRGIAIQKLNKKKVRYEKMSTYSDKHRARLVGEEFGKLKWASLDILVKLLFIVRVVGRNTDEHFVEQHS